MSTTEHNHIHTGSQPPVSVPPPPSATPSRQPHSRGKQFSTALVLIMLCAVAAFGGAWAANALFSDTTTSSVVEQLSESDGNTIVTADEEAIASVAQAVGPSVVSIVTTTRAQSVFGAYDGQGAGTGVIVSQDGYIMTNNHVIDGARSVSVVMSDGSSYDDVEVVGSDPLNDIAFLKIVDASGLTAATLGDSGSVRIGQRVVAIGNALGQFQNTVTSGIVSGTGRPIVAGSGDGRQTETLTDLIQTDAAINSGNSGGPLVNTAGQVIGINTAVATDANGIGFAIPINATKGILAGVLETGRVSRAYLGVQYLDITPGVASEFGLSERRGAYVYARTGSAVINGSPADDAGVRDGDIITKVNDAGVGERGSMSSLIGQYRPGDEVELTVVRNGSIVMLTATLTEYQATGSAS